MGVGFIIGPVMGGLLGAVSLRLPFFAAAALAMANLLYGYFVLPESLPLSQRKPFKWRSVHPVAALACLGPAEGCGGFGGGGGVERAGSVCVVHQLGAVHHVQVWLGPAGKRLVAGGGWGGFGGGPGLLDGAFAQMVHAPETRRC